jgi:hypothetical protein
LAHHLPFFFFLPTTIVSFRLPPERQYHTVDMQREDMDMLEWLVRCMIPIPKRYYWEDGSSNNRTTPFTKPIHPLPTHVRIWHNTIGFFDTCIQWLDQTSEPWLQPTTSRFEYVRAYMTPQQLEQCQQQQQQQQQQQRRARLRQQQQQTTTKMTTTTTMRKNQNNDPFSIL